MLWYSIDNDHRSGISNPMHFSQSFKLRATLHEELKPNSNSPVSDHLEVITPSFIHLLLIVWQGQMNLNNQVLGSPKYCTPKILKNYWMKTQVTWWPQLFMQRRWSISQPSPPMKRGNATIIYIGPYKSSTMTVKVQHQPPTLNITGNWDTWQSASRGQLVLQSHHHMTTITYMIHWDSTITRSSYWMSEQ